MNRRAIPARMREWTSFRLETAVAHPAAPTEAVLVSRAAGGDEDAVTALYDAYAGPIYGFGLRRLGDPLLAEELVQVVMTRLWRRAGRYEPTRGSVRTWVFTMARSAAIDLYRSRPRDRPEAALPEQAEIIDELEGLVRAEAVRAALDRLSGEHREVLALAYFRGFSQTEIAARLGLPLGTVKSRTFYALKAFRLACDELEVGA